MSKKPKAVLFDMGDTLIEYLSTNYLKANKILLDHSENPYDVTPEEVQQLAESLSIEIYGQRDLHNIEINIRSFQRLLYQMCGVSFNINEFEVESLFNKNAFEKKIIDDILIFLEYLESNSIRTGIISNSSFSRKALMQELEDCGINHNFELVMSSSEYCIRKPDRRLFDIALRKMNLNPEDVWYIGNSFEYDVVGATNAGLNAIWYNRDNLKSEKHIDYIEFSNYKSILEYIKQLNEN